MTYYIMRFDDINPKMNWEKFKKIKSILKKYKIKSILGVIPKCEDKEVSKFPENKNYISDLQRMKLEGDLIAQHGFTHITDSKNKGLFGNKKKSEFAGLDYQTQYERIKKGKNILIENQIWQPIFMAPHHTFDNITLEILKNLDFKLVTDGFGRYPYELKGLLLIPQLSSMPLPSFLPLISQLCIHINNLSDKKLNYLINFIEKNNHLFISPKDALKFKRSNSLLRLEIENKIIEFLIRLYRKIK